MTFSDKIELACIVITAITAVVAVIISIFTLRQNSRMIEDANRPYISIYGLSTYMGFRQYYIIIKNFGQSSACIDSLTYDFDIAKISKHNACDPFSCIDGVTIVPGQAFRSAIDFDKIDAYKISCINFHIVYSSGTHTYKEDVCLKLDANTGNLEAHNNENVPAINTISETLQDMHIKSL